LFGLLCGALVCAGLGLAVPVTAAVHDIDTAASEATFSLRVAWLRRIDGTFTTMTGTIELLPERDVFSVDVQISANDLEMASPSHAAWARSEEFFDAGRYPWMAFSAHELPTRILRDGGELQGELMLRGVRRPQRLLVEPAACDRPGIDCPVMARAEIRRGDYGMTSRRVVVSDRVRLQLSIQLQK